MYGLGFRVKIAFPNFGETSMSVAILTKAHRDLKAKQWPRTSQGPKPLGEIDVGDCFSGPCKEKVLTKQRTYIMTILGTGMLNNCHVHQWSR